MIAMSLHEYVVIFSGCAVPLKPNVNLFSVAANVKFSIIKAEAQFVERREIFALLSRHCVSHNVFGVGLGEIWSSSELQCRTVAILLTRSDRADCRQAILLQLRHGLGKSQLNPGSLLEP